MLRPTGFPNGLKRPLFLLTFFFAPLTAASGENWPQWRGIDNRGISRANPPIHWSSTKNVRWRKPVPGEGKSTPILWKDQIFLLTAIAESDLQDYTRERRHEPLGSQTPQNKVEGYKWYVLSLNRHTGTENWRRALTSGFPHEPGHPTNSLASGSPVTDGSQLYVSLGSRGIFCLDLAGKIVWQRALGTMKTRFGFGEASTPAVYQKTLIIQWDHEGQSAVYALNTHNGETIWRVPRSEPTTWSTPLIVNQRTTPQVILNGKTAASYRLADGKQLWSIEQEGVNPIACPMRNDDLAFLILGYRGYTVNAINLVTPKDGRGLVRWSHSDTGSYVASATICENKLFVTKGLQGIVSVIDSTNGQVIVKNKRYDALGTLYASPLAVLPPDPKGEIATAIGRIETQNQQSPRIYYCSRDGTTVVIRGREPFDVLAVNQLEQTLDASPVASGTKLYLRTSKSLYCLENQPRNNDQTGNED